MNLSNPLECFSYQFPVSEYALQIDFQLEKHMNIPMCQRRQEVAHLELLFISTTERSEKLFVALSGTSILHSVLHLMIL
jgi:hypothetical protein